MFCSDDLHPDDLIKGHINLLVNKALQHGNALFDVLKASSYNVVQHYGLDIGLLQKGDPADFIVVNNLKEFKVLKTYINGQMVFDGRDVLIDSISEKPKNVFKASVINKEDLDIPYKTEYVKVIEAIDGELVTKQLLTKASNKNGSVGFSTESDVLKIAVQNRYKHSTPAVGLITGFNLKEGALASSIAHDSHNIVCVGTNDELIAETMNWIIARKGGIAFHDGKSIDGITLDIAGIVSRGTIRDVAEKYAAITSAARINGSTLKAPFMTLAFMSLLVIPELKLSDKGLFDGNTFQFTSIYAEQ
jgi:adenine deaminase